MSRLVGYAFEYSHGPRSFRTTRMSLTELPPIQRRFNVILFGEMGAGKSSVINLILGLDHDVAKTSSGASSCTLDSRPYDVTIQGRDFRLFDTVGLVDPQSLRDPDALIGAINKAYRLVRYLSDTGGINLLVFCIRRGRITVNMQQNYLLFHDFLCHKKVPIVLVVTHLEHEENMEDWWISNHSHFEECGIYTVGHACITAKREFRDRYHASRPVVHDLLIAHGCGIGFTQEGISWVADLFQKLHNFVGFRPGLDSVKVRARKLREYGLREHEIAILLTKIGAVDEDMALVKPPRSRRRALQWPRTRTTTITIRDIFRAIRLPQCSKATITVDQNDEASFPNDLTSQVVREGRDPVASGGFADIYRGVLQLNARPTKVAIKAIKTYSGEEGDVFAKKQKRLRREVKVWLSVKHDNVLPLLGTTMGFGQFPAMVCPWAENGTLTSYVGRCYTTFPVVEVLRLLDDIASGLRYLHSRSIVHGDLSGSNILIRENGSPYIADFGLSTLLTELEGATFATSFHERGTIRWMAPELLALEVPENEPEDSPHVLPTTHSDVYSFGGVMLQILSGKVPYHYYLREMQVVHAVSKGITPTRPSTALVTECRWTFIQRCWSTVEIAQTRPSSEEIVVFTKNELASINSL